MTLAKLHESDAAMAALAEELGQLSSTAKGARGEADRLAASIRQAEQAKDDDLTGLADLEHRLELASDEAEIDEPDPDERDRLAEEARLARAAEMDARLALRTLEERVRALAGRADALRQAAENERQARARAVARRERMLREAESPRPCTRPAATWPTRSSGPSPWPPPNGPRPRPPGPRPRPR